MSNFIPSSHTTTIESPLTPNRTEFFRDAESASRLNSPMDAKRYLISLCEVRAIKESIEHNYMSMVHKDNYIRELKRELYYQCIYRGYGIVPIRHIKINVVVTP